MRGFAALSLRAVEWTDDPSAVAPPRGGRAGCASSSVSDKRGPDAQFQARRHAATEPELARVVAEVERPAGELGREADLIDAYREVAPSVPDAEIQRAGSTRCRRPSRAVRRDLVLAREYYLKVLDGQPDDRRALAALSRASTARPTTTRSSPRCCCARPMSRAPMSTIAWVPWSRQRGCTSRSNDSDDAITTWEQASRSRLSARMPSTPETLYREQWQVAGRRRSFLSAGLGSRSSIDEAGALRAQLGEIHEKHLHDIETAIDNYSAALGGDSSQSAGDVGSGAVPGRSRICVRWPRKPRTDLMSRSSAGRT
ncbi:MAG: hypothetical protein IPQ07_28245 [Myxococcales bacterium]|nr:hypothetical protein [Myxococcales bacterium]